MSNGVSHREGMRDLNGMNMIDTVRVTNVPCILLRNVRTVVSRLHELRVRVV